jgi:SAM-dependent methyltransferase
MRDWELCQVLQAIAERPPTDRILDTGSFNTYLALYLSKDFGDVTASDLLGHRLRKSLARALHFAPAKSTEAPYFAWTKLMRRGGVNLKSYDLTSIDLPDASFDVVIALSVVEHILLIEKSIVELYRVLAPGGKLLITTDCSPQPRAYREGVRYFSKTELDALFSRYPVTSPRNTPDFSKENWCYGGKEPVITCFVEITKPANSAASAKSVRR